MRIIRNVALGLFLCGGTAYAEAPGGGGVYGILEVTGGGHTPGTDFELNVGDKLIFDADEDANNYITGTDTTVFTYIEGTEVLTLQADLITLSQDTLIIDNTQLCKMSRTMFIRNSINSVRAWKHITQRC